MSMLTAIGKLEESDVEPIKAGCDLIERQRFARLYSTALMAWMVTRTTR